MNLTGWSFSKHAKRNVVEIEKPPLMLTEAEHGVVESSEADGNIGNLMLQKFTILMDYVRKKIYILPPEE